MTSFSETEADNKSVQYFSPASSAYESRALPPFMEKEPYMVYEVLKPFKVKAGEICPWFDQPGLRTQFYTDFQIVDYSGIPIDADVQSLIDNEYIQIISP